jgi:uncharacterized phiE125 gp8 family phage protein
MTPFDQILRRNALARYGVRVVVRPTVEQLTLEECRLHLRLDALGSPAEHPDDAWITSMIPTAREYCENYMGRSLAPQTLELSMRQFPGSVNAYLDPLWASVDFAPGLIELRGGPVAGIESVIYIDGTGTPQIADPSTYGVDVIAEPALIFPAYGTSWPTTQFFPNSVRIRYQAGYDAPGDSPNERPLPYSIRAAMLLMLGHFYNNRENTQAGAGGSTLIHEIPFGAQALMDPYVLDKGFA